MNKTPLPDGWIELSGKAYPTWPAVLNAAHEKGLSTIHTELVQIPTEENGHVAIVKAEAHFTEAVFGTPAIFEAYGDASPKNVNSRIATALIRMAETRGKGRALRDACNIGQTLAEEIPEEEREAERYVRPPQTQRARHDPDDHADRAPAAKTEASVFACQKKDCPAVLSAAEAALSLKHFDCVLCPEHAAATDNWPHCAADGCTTFVPPAKATATRAVYQKSLCRVHAAEAGALLGKVAATA